MRLPPTLISPEVGWSRPADEIQQRGLARARRAHQRDEVALGNVEAEAVQHFDLLLAALVGLRDTPYLNHGLGHVYVPATEQSSGPAAVTAPSSFSSAGASTMTDSPGLTPVSTWRELPNVPPSVTARRCALPSFSTNKMSLVAVPAQRRRRAPERRSGGRASAATGFLLLEE